MPLDLEGWDASEMAVNRAVPVEEQEALQNAEISRLIQLLRLGRSRDREDAGVINQMLKEQSGAEVVPAELDRLPGQASRRRGLDAQAEINRALKDISGVEVY